LERMLGAADKNLQEAAELQAKLLQEAAELQAKLSENRQSLIEYLSPLGRQVQVARFVACGDYESATTSTTDALYDEAFSALLGSASALSCGT
jgi:hypothetical protein